MIQLLIGIFIGFVVFYLLNKVLGPFTSLSKEINEVVEEIAGGVSLKEVENKGKRGAADSSYWLLSDGEDKYLFTSEQLKTAKNRALKNPEDIS